MNSWSFYHNQELIQGGHQYVKTKLQKISRRTPEAKFFFQVTQKLEKKKIVDTMHTEKIVEE